MQTFRLKGSKFIGVLLPCDSSRQFERELEKQKGKHPSATHHCHAWRIHPEKPEENTQDDGEPSGTAGLPILNQLKSADLINCGCIVIRYYGGTKLGKPGLIEAYGHTANLCIDSAVLHTLRATRLYKINYPYEAQSLIDQWKKHYELIEKEADYLADVTLTVACPKNRSGAFMDELKRSAHLLYSFEKLTPSFEVEQ